MNREAINYLSNRQILERFKHLVHIRGEKQALAITIEMELNEEILLFEAKLRQLLEN